MLFFQNYPKLNPFFGLYPTKTWLIRPSCFMPCLFHRQKGGQKSKILLWIIALGHQMALFILQLIPPIRAKYLAKRQKLFSQKVVLQNRRKGQIRLSYYIQTYLVKLLFIFSFKLYVFPDLNSD